VIYILKSGGRIVRLRVSAYFPHSAYFLNVVTFKYKKPIYFFRTFPYVFSYLLNFQNCKGDFIEESSQQFNPACILHLSNDQLPVMPQLWVPTPSQTEKLFFILRKAFFGWPDRNFWRGLGWSDHFFFSGPLVGQRLWWPLDKGGG
jgi:hypothetical protein